MRVGVKANDRLEGCNAGQEETREQQYTGIPAK